jgi:hypothetical protein
LRLATESGAAQMPLRTLLVCLPTLWLKYRQHDGEITGGPFSGDLDDFQYVSAGGPIYF